MALTATATQGFERLSYTTGRQYFKLPGDPGVTFTRGDRCSMSGGVLIVGTDSAAEAIFTVDKTTVCPAATQHFVKPADISDKESEAQDLTLVPVRCDVPSGVELQLATFANQGDETVVSYVAGTRAVECTTGFGADDRPNGALVYVYAGPGSGEINVVEDYDHAGGAAELLLIMHRPFKATLTTDSKFIVLASAAAANAVGCFGKMDLKDGDELDVTDGADDGNYIAFTGWDNLQARLKNLTLPVIKSSSLFTA